MKENSHKEPKQKPSGRVPKEHATNRLPKTLAREAWLKSKEKVISATRTRSDSDYASAQEVEEDVIQQGEAHLENGTLFVLRKTGAVVTDRFTRKREPDEPLQDDPCMEILRNRAGRKPQPVKTLVLIRKLPPRRSRNDELLRSKAGKPKRVSNRSRNLCVGCAVSIGIKNNSVLLPIPPAKKNRQGKQRNARRE